MANDCDHDRVAKSSRGPTWGRSHKEAKAATELDSRILNGLASNGQLGKERRHGAMYSAQESEQGDRDKDIRSPANLEANEPRL